MVGVPSAILADDVKVAVAIHRDAFVRLAGNAQRIARIRDDRQRAEDVSGSVDVNDLARFLTQNESDG
jgi:uncharacterized protein YdeI (BOF family)